MLLKDPNHHFITLEKILQGVNISTKTAHPNGYFASNEFSVKSFWDSSIAGFDRTIRLVYVPNWERCFIDVTLCATYLVPHDHTDLTPESSN